MKRIAATAVLLCLSACGGGADAKGGGSEPATSSPSPDAQTVAVNLSGGVFGDLSPNPRRPWTTGVSCTSFSFGGEEVRILDGAGQILAVGNFPNQGVWLPDPGVEEHLAKGETEWRWDGTCTWTAEVGNVGEAPVYQVEIEGFEDSKAYNAADLEADDWTIDLEA
jgi:hypothetical protein